MVTLRNEFLGAFDPPTLAARASARIFAAGFAPIRYAEVVVAARNPVCIRQMVRCVCVSRLRRCNRYRSQHSVDGQTMPHISQQPLQDLDRVASGVDVHIKNARLQDVRQHRNQWPFEVVPDEDIDRLIARQRPHIRYSLCPVLVQI